MDPLSISASIVALGHALKVGIKLIQTIASLKDAPAEFLELQDEFVCMQAYSQHLPQFVLAASLSSSSLGLPPGWLNFVAGPIARLTTHVRELEDISRELGKRIIGTDAGAQFRISWMMWKFDKEKVQRLLNKIRREREHLSSALLLLQQSHNIVNSAKISSIQLNTESISHQVQIGIDGSQEKLSAIESQLYDVVGANANVVVTSDESVTDSSSVGAEFSSGGTSPKPEARRSESFDYQEPTGSFLSTVLKALTFVQALPTNSEYDRVELSENSDLSEGRSAVVRLPGESLSSPAPKSNALDACFDRFPSFFPEAYCAHKENGRSILWPMKERSRLQSLGKYYLVYAQHPRCWRRITLSVPLKDTKAIYDKLWPWNWQVDGELERFLGQSELFNTVTNIRLRLLPPSGSDKFEGPRFDFSAAHITEDEDEVTGLPPSELTIKADDWGCRQIHESEIISQFHIQRFTYAVMFRGKPCVEKKLSFTWSGESYAQDLVALHVLEGSKHVAQLVGVVCDDSKYLKGFICERAELGCIADLIRVADRQSEEIPWSVRERWARHIVKGLVEVHSKGLVVGKLQLTSVAVDRDYKAKLVRLDGEACHKVVGCVAPEVLEQVDHVFEVRRTHMTARTDIYQLGLILWLLAAHLPIHWVYAPAM